MTTTPGLCLALDGGGQASLVETDGALAVIVSSRPFPPGATLGGRAEDAPGTFALKVRSCRRAPPDEATEPSFRIEGRWVNLSRAQRLRLLGDGTAS